VEALVALLIVSIGMLGVADLILSSLRETAGALARTQAVLLVSDMMDRIRANPDAEEAYDCAAYPGDPAEQACAPSGAPAVECTARELAEDDLARWQKLTRQTLPFVAPGKCVANVTYFAAAASGQPARYRVDVTWSQPGARGAQSLSGELWVAGRRAT
jgi:type IV pilus assembly protein PilV